MVMASNLSAMFDPLSVPSPNAFRTDRPWETYILWGYGIHACFGAYLNRANIPAILKPLLAKRTCAARRGRRARSTRRTRPSPSISISSMMSDPGGREWQRLSSSPSRRWSTARRRGSCFVIIAPAIREGPPVRLGVGPRPGSTAAPSSTDALRLRPRLTARRRLPAFRALLPPERRLVPPDGPLAAQVKADWDTYNGGTAADTAVFAYTICCRQRADAPRLRRAVATRSKMQ